MAFGPKALGRDEGAVPVKETNLTAANAPSDAVAQAALNAARHSYAPYSGANSGVAISTRSGRIHRGSYIENVAFNPSLPPLETALVQLIVAGEEYATITRVVLAENKRAKISQKSAAEAVMASVAPSVRLEIVAAELK
jgi:cytidine deaminase